MKVLVGIVFCYERRTEMSDRRDSKNRKLNRGEYQRPDGRYAYRYTDQDGKERWVYSWRLTATDISPKGKLSEVCLRDLEVEIAKSLFEGLRKGSQETTLNSIFEDYMKIKINIKEKTRLYYKGIWDRHVRNTLGPRKISDLKYSDFVRFFNYLIENQGLKLSSIRNTYTLIRPVLELAVKDELIRKNPTDGVMKAVTKSRSIKPEKRHSLTIPQQEAFLKFLRDTPRYRRWFRLFIFLLGTGCRIGEARGLTWDDCDFKKGTIWINKQLSFYRAEGEEKYKNHVSTTKTDSGNRMIPMFSSVREVLLEEWRVQGLSDVKSEVVDGVSGFIFRTRTGRCIDAANVDGAINRIISRYNTVEEIEAERENREPIFLPHFSAHNLRHTFCTRMCENKPNLKVVQEIMGHADIFTTMNIYDEATEEETQSGFEKLDGKVVRI